jgi:hypothetical protein
MNDLRYFYFCQAIGLLFRGSWLSKIVLSVISVLMTLAIPSFPLVIIVLFLFLFFLISPIFSGEPNNVVSNYLLYPSFILTLGSWITVIFLALMKYFNI